VIGDLGVKTRTEAAALFAMHHGLTEMAGEPEP
jgi:hypothetical protein